MKICTQCNQPKALTEFYGESKHKDSRRSECKSCSKSRTAAYRKTPDVKRRTYARRHVPENMAADRVYAQAHREKWRSKDLIRLARIRAIKKGLPFDLDLYGEEIQRRIDAGLCEVSGIQLNVKGGRTYDSPSLDRKDPQKGYVLSNIRIVCHAINSALGDWGEEVLDAIVTSWIRKREGERTATQNGRKVKKQTFAAYVSFI